VKLRHKTSLNHSLKNTSINKF